MAALRQKDFDSGRIWIGFQVVAVLVALLGLGCTALLLASAVTAEVELGQVPPGRPYHVIDTLEGTEAVSIDCPPAVRSLWERPEVLCRDSTRANLMAVPWAAGVAVAGGGLFLVARGRRHQARADRAVLAAADQLRVYRQDSMPWSYWWATGLLGGFSLVGLRAVGSSLLSGSDQVDVFGALAFGCLVFEVVYLYGRRHGYELVLDGDEIEWRAPLRRRRIPLASVRSAEVHKTGRVRERMGTLLLDTGEKVTIVVPNARHERRFNAFCRAAGGASWVAGTAAFLGGERR